MKLIFAALFCLSVFTPALADGPSKFDEYASLTFAAEKPRLDALASVLKNAPGIVAWYFIFAERASCPGEARRRAVMAKNYLVKTHGIEADRIIWVDMGYHERLIVELWLGVKAYQPVPTYLNLGRAKVRMSRHCQPKNNRWRRRSFL